MLPVLKTLDEADIVLRRCGWSDLGFPPSFLNEDPWERLRTIGKHVKRQIADVTAWSKIYWATAIMLMMLFALSFKKKKNRS